jgi:deoxyribonucleoside regulator
MPDISQGSSGEARLLTDERFLRKVAYMYYEDGNSQEAIAETEFCSRQTVSKALQKARDRGIVRISIVPDLRTGFLRNLSREVRRELNLEDLVLVPGRNFENTAAGQTIDEVVAEVTNAAADYLDQLLTDSDILAVSGGKTFMRNVVRYLKPARPLPHLQVISTIGFVQARTSFGDANLIAYDIAQVYGASHTWFTAPAFIPHLSDISFETIMSLNSRLSPTREAIDLSARANIVMMGLWTPETNDDLIIKGVLNREQVNTIDAFHPVLDINHWVFDTEGRCINELLDPPPYHLTGFPIPRLSEKIKKEGTKVILVTGGSPAYIPAIRTALKAGLANILVTDHITAQLLLPSPQEDKGK